MALDRDMDSLLDKHDGPPDNSRFKGADMHSNPSSHLSGCNFARLRRSEQRILYSGRVALGR